MDQQTIQLNIPRDQAPRLVDHLRASLNSANAEVKSTIEQSMIRPLQEQTRGHSEQTTSR